MNILVTGGIGFIGSHTCVELIENGYNVIIIDNLSNAKIEVLDKIEKITKIKPKFYEGDIRDEKILKDIFIENKIDAVIHFAGLKSVGESVEKPLKYYNCNISGTIMLLETMQKYNCNKIVFSSSATVYGIPKTVPITEDFPCSTTNPYGTTKLMIENILKDVQYANKNLIVTVLRYFNPVGAHESGIIGEEPNGIPNNIMPRIIRVAMGKDEAITIYGDDYKTKDGTGVRDYIHVVDLAKGHIKALENMKKPEVYTYNLGTGKGYSVLELVNTFSKVNNIEIKTIKCPRRKGDVAECYADITKAEKELNWKAEKGIEEMCKSAWKYLGGKKY